jgi:hypothetical protein
LTTLLAGLVLPTLLLATLLAGFSFATLLATLVLLGLIWIIHMLCPLLFTSMVWINWWQSPSFLMSFDTEPVVPRAI